MAICYQNQAAIIQADEVHVWWDKTSKGYLFDLGMCAMVGKPLKIINTNRPQRDYPLTAFT